MSPEAYQAVNSLMAMLRQFDVVRLVRAHYKQFDNDIPATLLTEQMCKVQYQLDWAQKGATMTQHDEVRMLRALKTQDATYASKREERDAVEDAVRGLQSTDDPSLVSLHDDLSARLDRLNKELTEGSA